MDYAKAIVTIALGKKYRLRALRRPLLATQQDAGLLAHLVFSGASVLWPHPAIAGVA